MKHIVLLAGSAGSFRVISPFLKNLSGNFSCSVIICIHRLRNVSGGLIEALSPNKDFTLKEAYDKERIREGVVYLAPANYHLLVDFFHCFNLMIDRPVSYSRPSIDISMSSFAEIFKENLTGVLLSGANMDGATGMKAISDYGGTTIIQDPDSSDIPVMPESALKLFNPDKILETEALIQHLLNLVNQR